MTLHIQTQQVSTGMSTGTEPHELPKPPNLSTSFANYSNFHHLSNPTEVPSQTPIRYLSIVTSLQHAHSFLMRVEWPKIALYWPYSETWADLES